MQSQIILLSNVKQDNIAQLVQKEFEMLGITGIKGKRIDAERAAIHKTIVESLSDYNVIMVIGGIGEGENDMTVSAVSSAIGFQTIQKDGELFPEGAEIFSNKAGKPSGCAISQGNQCIIMLPGDSETLQFMLCYRVSKYLADFIGGVYSIKTLRAAGISKAEAEEFVAGAETSGTTVRVFEDGKEVAVQVFAKGEDRKETAARTNSAIKEIVSVMGPSVYAVGAENVGQAFAQELSRKDLKAAIAVEGIQRSEIASAAFVEEYVGNYLGTSQGISRYDIPEKLLKRHGANSTWTAAVLAGEVCKTYGSNIGIAITVDPSKNNEGANIAVCMGDNVWTEHVTAETREELIAAAGARAVHLARCVVSAYPKLYENSVSLMSAVSGKTRFKTSVSKENTKWYSRFVPMKGDSKSELIRKSIFILCVLVFIGCMGYLSTKVFDSVKHRDLAANLGDMVGKTDPEKIPYEWEYNPKLYDLYKENSDTIGYVKIDNTNVAFPVVQTEKANDKGQKGQYYLRKDFYGAYSMYGTPFLDYRCDAQVEIQSTNFIVYGHNVYNDGQMFSDLIKYRQLKFYKEHPIVHFDTLYGDADWLVIGVILTNAYEKDGPVWDYNNFINGDEAETKEFINQVAKRTMIVTGVDYNVSDHFLTLSTCSYDFTDARVVIIARQVREGEDISGLDTSKAYYNSNPLMPDKWYQAISEAQQSESDASFGEAEQPGGDVEEVDIISLPDKIEFKVGEAISLEGLEFLAYRADSDEPETVVEGFTYSPEGPFDTPGKYEITVEYQGYVFKIRINVVADESSSSSTSSEPSSSSSSSSEIKVEKIDVASKPSKTTYKVGEKFDVSGLSITVKKSDGTEETITDTSKFKVSYSGSFDTAGTVTVTVTYGEGEKAVTTTFDVTVKAESSSSSSSETSSSTSSETSSSTSSETSSSTSSETSSSTSSDTSPSTSIESESSVIELPPSSSESTPESSEQESSTGKLMASRPRTSKYYEQSKIDTVKVNGKTMTVYDAVCQIVAYEAGKGQPEEHVKAQAVASYTYLMNGGGNISAGLSTAKLDSRTEKLVAEVIGYAVLDDRSNNFILATYFSESCGETANAEWVWGYANRNLISVSSPVDGKTSKTYRISSSSFKDKVESKTNITLSGDPEDWIGIYSYWGSSDYVNQVELGGTKYSARKLRETVLGGSNLRSTAFDVEYDSAKDQFVFTMRGYGHGVGMSAVGSIEYAKKGYTWDEILLKYYSNCYIGYKEP